MPWIGGHTYTTHGTIVFFSSVLLLLFHSWKPFMYWWTAYLWCASVYVWERVRIPWICISGTRSECQEWILCKFEHHFEKWWSFNVAWHACQPEIVFEQKKVFFPSFGFFLSHYYYFNILVCAGDIHVRDDIRHYHFMFSHVWAATCGGLLPLT